MSNAEVKVFYYAYIYIVCSNISSHTSNIKFSEINMNIDRNINERSGIHNTVYTVGTCTQYSLQKSKH